MRIGIDIGSTTVKVVLIDDNDKILFRAYERHLSKVREKTAEMLEQLDDRLSGKQVQAAVTVRPASAFPRRPVWNFAGSVSDRGSSGALYPKPTSWSSWAGKTRKSSSLPAGWRSG